MANEIRKAKGAVQIGLSVSGNVVELHKGAVQTIVIVPPGGPSGSGRTGPGLTYGKFGKMGA